MKVKCSIVPTIRKMLCASNKEIVSDRKEEFYNMQTKKSLFICWLFKKKICLAALPNDKIWSFKIKDKT